VDRRARILSLIDPATMRGVEVGPSFSPVVPKRSGADVTVIDHADAATLREKYRVHGVDVDAIEDVDVIWSGGPLTAVLGERAPFDYIIASHVIEHLPDPLGFLAECESLLAPGGVLSLVVPDSRYSFDCLRPLTSIGQWVDARLDGRTRHTAGTVLDHTLHAAKRGEISWHAGTVEPLAMVHQRDHVDAMYAQSSTSDEYIDVHAWVFTRPSFCYLIDMARALGLTSFVVAEQHDTVGAEFYVTLCVPRDAPGADERSRVFDERLAVMLAARPQEPAAATVEPRRPAVWRRALRRAYRAVAERSPATMKAISASASTARSSMRLASGSPKVVRFRRTANSQRVRSSSGSASGNDRSSTRNQGPLSK
jgi:predicted SAM-dependent methyltransferase